MIFRSQSGMAEICCGIVSDSEASNSCEPGSRARRRRMEIRRLKIVAGVAVPSENGVKRQKLETYPELSPRNCANTVERCDVNMQRLMETETKDVKSKTNENFNLKSEQSTKVLENQSITSPHPSPILVEPAMTGQSPKFGITSVCGRRRDMEDAVAIHPSFCRKDTPVSSGFHFFAVYDGHGCSHVAMSCKDRLHQLLKEELLNSEETTDWRAVMERSFSRMDTEVQGWNNGVLKPNCRCELQTPQCDAVGSTAVVAVVTPDKIIVANCGDSRAVLCRNGKAVPLSSDHKPDRPDELVRIENAGGRVIYWDGARVLGVLAMSRAIGDNYLKPFVSSEPEVTITERTSEDECLILASDGLWDVVSNDTACGIVRKCLRGQVPLPPWTATEMGVAGESSDKACSDASMLLTKFALARNSTDNVSAIVIDLRKDT